MRIEEIMRKRVVTVHTDTTIEDALELLRGNRIRHLPVMDGEKLVGIISDRDLRDALPSSLLTHEDDHEILKTPVGAIMTKEVITAHRLDFIQDAAKTIYDHKVGSLPVLEDGRLVGLVTESDILNRLVELFGVNRPSSLLEVKVEDRAGSLADVCDVFREAGVNVCSMIISPAPEPHFKILMCRVQTIDPRKLIEMLRQRGFEVVPPVEGGVTP
jgi:acetoin utilization protein AcuB